MAISKKVTDEKKQALSIEVTRANEIKGKDVIMFDMVVNGVTIYGCSYREIERKDGSGSFASIGFPSRKGSDDKWYKHAYVKLEESDIDAIEKGIEAKLN